jgi:putative tryptophan/tyrosine transport system substrate-binding protein
MRRREFIAGLGGAATVWPLVARAQQWALPVIGYLSGGTESSDQNYLMAFRQGLGEHGYSVGRNVEVLYRSSGTMHDRLPGLAADLVRREVAIIVATRGHAPALAAQAATSTIPIVFDIGADPVELGLVRSLNRPGGNVTGVTVLTKNLIAKRLELLHEIVPAARTIGFLVNPNSPVAEAEKDEVESAALSLGVRMESAIAGNPDGIEAAFTLLHGLGVDALLTASDPLFWTQLPSLAARYRLPTIYIGRKVVDVGGLMSYGPNFYDSIRLTGNYAGRVLKGERPADLPVQQASRIDMVLNLKTAKALGLAVPLSILLRADEVIE